MKTSIKDTLNLLTKRSSIASALPSFRRVNVRGLATKSIRMQDNFEEGPGGSPYHLYAFLSTLFDDSIILDVGSQYGNSALAFSYNESNHVISYEIDPWYSNETYHTKTRRDIERDNITWRDIDFRDDEDIDYEKVKIILIDIDPHGHKIAGKEEELRMIEHLLEKGWSGVLIFDDIDKGCQMQDFWNELSIAGWTKIDVCELGHSSGTGILYV